MKTLAISFIFVAIALLLPGDAACQTAQDTGGLSPPLQPRGWPEGGTTQGAPQAPGDYASSAPGVLTPNGIPGTGPVPFGAGWTVPGPSGRTENAGPPGSANDSPAASGGSFPGTTSSGAFPGGSMNTATSGSAGTGTGTGSTYGGSGTGSFGASIPGMDSGIAR